MVFNFYLLKPHLLTIIFHCLKLKKVPNILRLSFLIKRKKTRIIWNKTLWSRIRKFGIECRSYYATSRGFLIKTAGAGECHHKNVPNAVKAVRRNGQTDRQKVASANTYCVCVNFRILRSGRYAFGFRRLPVVVNILIKNHVLEQTIWEMTHVVTIP